MTATETGVQSVQQDFVESIQRRSLLAPFPLIAGGDDAAASAAGEGGDGGGSSPSPGQGGGTSASKGGDGFNWGLFPDVPEEQRPLLEPHLKNVQGHVTKLEQQFAPFKDLPQGVTPDVIQGLVRLDQAFAQDPMGTWLRMGQQMQSEGKLSEDLDFDIVQQILNGTFEDEDEGGEGPAGEGGGQGVDPRLQAALDEVAQLKERLDGRDQQELQAQQDQLLQQTMSEIKAQLTEAGVPENAISDEFITAAIMSQRGDKDAAVKSILDFREANLKGFTEKARSQNDDRELNLPKGAPKAEKSNRRNDAWGKANAGAKHMLEKLNAGS